MTRRSVLLLPALAASAAAATDWSIEELPGRTRMNYRGQPFSDFYHGKEWDKPFLYPLLAADGTEVSRGWPVAPRPAENQDHAWHRGLWWGHGDINGEDFWREKSDAKTGRRSTATILSTSVKWSAAKNDALRLDAEHSLVTASGSALAAMSTVWTLRQVGSARQIDFRMRLNADKPLRFADTDDGGFAFRLREEFREDRGAMLRNAAGSTGAKAIWGKPSPWTDYSTRIGEKTYGVAILSHPSNPRHPSGWHARNYGLNSANPFAESSFLEEKGGQKGAWILEAGKTLHLHYRVLIHTGTAKEAAIGEDFARYEKEKLS